MARMELPVLDKFCFIFDLRTGCIVMGIINSILTFILSVLLITFAVNIRDPTEAQMKRDDIDSGMSSVVYTIVVLLAVLLLVKFLLDLVFVYAVYKEKCGIMKKYCIFWIIFLVLFIIGFLKTLFHMDAGHVIAQILFLGKFDLSLHFFLLLPLVRTKTKRKIIILTDV
ncbi:uncharacterized protein LOC113503859 isoform X2 [Trichoplusia ni]|uniref:Uncharacterized protein LOC113503859 isoform X2 n=1 Tax=Trichoplusia ni TaxID=7111 RepID=A0A7E5WLZ2_TRINI|nr:uncharacterized protein LOC113503859 isoform X2 [Trichoplusia ni]